MRNRPGRLPERVATVAIAALVQLVAASVAWAPAAEAQTASSVTLASSAATIAYGGRVTLSGSVSPAAGGQTVEVLDDTDAIVTTATTDTAGAFTVDYAPGSSVTLRAVWQSVASDPVTIGVRAIVDVRLSMVRLFDTVTVRGSVAPAHPGAKVEVSLVHAGDVVAQHHAAMGSAGGFATTFSIDQPGTYRVRATFADADHLRGSAHDGPRTTPLPPLHVGSRSVYVKLLERRLVELHYRLVGVNRGYDDRTADAVVAFRKVQGMQRVFTVDTAVWRALADPKIPRPRFDMKRFHFEVDQTRQVLYTVQDGRVTNILHVSTGKPSTPTPDGSYHVYSKCPCLTSLGLYYPSFFDGGRALHGYVEVPVYAASHGCVRIPYWNAKWVYRLAVVGTPVMVYH